MPARGLLAFAVGVLLAALVPAMPPVWLASGFTVCLLLLLLASRLGLSLPDATIPAFALLLGASWFCLHAGWQLATEWPESRAGETVQLTGTVVGLPRQHGDSWRFEFRPDADGWAELDAGPKPALVQLAWFRPPLYLQPGQSLGLTVRLYPPHGRSNPGDIDRRRFWLAQRVGALGTVVEGQGLGLMTGGRAAVDRQRQYLAEVIQVERYGRESAALKRALLIADRGGMERDLSELLRRTGTAHLLAISGLHVGMVAMLAGLLGGWLLSPLALLIHSLDRRRLSIVCALTAAAAYALMAGLTLPTQRALIMLCVGLGAVLLRRAIRPAHALLLALFCILLLDPLSPLASGFWLSFAAVAVLIWVFAWRPEPAGSGAVSGLIKAQLAIALGMLPLNVGLFQQLSLVAMPANLFAIPLVGMWILPGLLVSGALIALDLPAAWPMAATAMGLEGLLQGLVWLDQFAWSHRQLAAPSLWTVVLAGLGSAWLLAPVGWPARWLGLPLLLPLFFVPPPVADEQRLDVHLLDVGQGQALVLAAGGQTFLYDTGPGDGEGGDLVGRLLAILSRESGVAQPDRVILSSNARQHAGGLGSLPESVQVWSPNGVRGTPCVAGQQHWLGAYQIEVLHPSAALPDLGHNSSCVLHVSGPGGRLLLLGSVDEHVERRLLLENPQLAVDVVLLARGGHRDGASAALLEAVDPSLALASVARFDRAGRPHPELLQRLDKAEVPLMTTGRCGAIQITFKPGQAPIVQAMAGQNRRFWRGKSACPDAS